MANRWEIMETITDFIFLFSKITPDSDYSHEIKRCLLLGRKNMTNLDSVLKSRYITLPTKICIVKSMFFYSLEGLMLKLKLQYFGHRMQRTDSFEKTLMLGKTEGRKRRGLQRMR